MKKKIKNYRNLLHEKSLFIIKFLYNFNCNKIKNRKKK